MVPPIDASQAPGSTDAHALSESGDHFNLLVAGQIVRHGANPWVGIGRGIHPWKSLYSGE
jgi:hypothetical protein